MNRPGLVPALILAVVSGVGLLLVSRFVAETRDASFILGAVWMALVALGGVLFTRSRPELRAPLAVAFAVTAIGVAAVGYWTGFRDTEADEDVIVATSEIAEEDRAAALAPSAAGEDEGGPGTDSAQEQRQEQRAAARRAERRREERRAARGPASVARAEFVGVDGHDATGVAEVVKDGDERTLTFTGFEVDPGPGVEVYLTRSPGEVGDRIELGGLKGTTGDQQYEIPADADLSEYDTVLLYCTPFTVRMAVAELG